MKIGDRVKVTNPNSSLFRELGQIREIHPRFKDPMVMLDGEDRLMKFRFSELELVLESNNSDQSPPSS